MVAITEEELLRQLSLYKWKDGYRCHKCGNENYKKGKTSHSRRCTDRACDYDESVIRFTLFDGIKFPVTKAYGIVEYFVTSCFIDYDEAVFESGVKRKETGAERIIEDFYNVGEIKSLNKLLEELDAQKRDVRKSPKDPAKYEQQIRAIEKSKEEKIFAYFNSKTPKVAELSQIFQVEENTVNKLLKKLYERMRMIDNTDSYKYYADNGQILYLADKFYFVEEAFSKFLPFFMLPLPEPLIGGQIKKNRKWYQLNTRTWEWYQVSFGRYDAHGVMRSYYNKEDEPEYLCEEES
jgi:hypothetical protein